MATFLDVMNLWDSPQALADDIGAKLTRIQKWRARRAIPPKAWPNILSAARRRGFDVNADTLIRMSARQATRETRVTA